MVRPSERGVTLRARRSPGACPGRHVEPFLLLSSGAPFGVGVLAGLLEGGHPPAALALYRRAGGSHPPPSPPELRRHPGWGLAVGPPPGPPGGEAPIARLARAHRVPVLELRVPGVKALGPALRCALGRIPGEPPVGGVVACLPGRLRADALALLPGGWLNVHPGPLPRYRGPAPVFWQLLAGEPRAALSVHRVDERLDTGPVVARRHLPWPEEPGWSALHRALGRHGGLLAGTLAGRGEGEGAAQTGEVPEGARERERTREEAGGSVQGLPGPEDFVLDPAWELSRARRYLMATLELGIAYRLEGGWRAEGAGPGRGPGVRLRVRALGRAIPPSPRGGGPGGGGAKGGRVHPCAPGAPFVRAAPGACRGLLLHFADGALELEGELVEPGSGSVSRC